jgi:hypothetical protein
MVHKQKATIEKSQSSAFRKAAHALKRDENEDRFNAALKRDVSKAYSNVVTMLEWVCPTKTEWIRPHCRVPEIIRQKP